MDAHLDTLNDESCQVNTYVGCITRRQAVMGSFTASSSSPSALEDENVDGSGNDDDDEDNGASSSSDDEMTAWVTYPFVIRDKKGE